MQSRFGGLLQSPQAWREASHIRQAPQVDLLVKSWTGWRSRLRLPWSSCPDSSCFNRTKERNQTVGREACGCGCVRVTIWVCIKVFRNKAGLTCKGGRRRQLLSRREFPPPLVFLLAVSIIHIRTNKPATALLFGPSRTYRACHSRWARPASRHHHSPSAEDTRSPSPLWAEMHLPATLSLVAFPISKLRS